MKQNSSFRIHHSELTQKIWWSLVLSVVFVFVLILIFSGLRRSETQLTSTEEKISLGQCDFKTTLARTNEEQTRGLMGVKNLATDQGLLFSYDQAGPVTFWMKNMLIPIDLVWLKDKAVIGWEENMRPDKGERVYPSPGAIDLVLEVAEGTIKRCEIEIGMRILNSKF